MSPVAAERASADSGPAPEDPPEDCVEPVPPAAPVPDGAALPDRLELEPHAAVATAQSRTHESNCFWIESMARACRIDLTIS
jgi:hypothetical protein